MMHHTPIFHTLPKPRDTHPVFATIKGMGPVGCFVQRHLFLSDPSIPGANATLHMCRLADGARRAGKLPRLQPGRHTRDQIRTADLRALRRLDSQIRTIMQWISGLPNATLAPFVDGLAPMGEHTAIGGRRMYRYTVHALPNLAVFSGECRYDPGVVLAMVVLATRPHASAHGRMESFHATLDLQTALPDHLPHLLDDTRPIRYI